MVLRKLLVVSAVALVLALPAFGQNRTSDRWVATWSTALVARPLGQGGPAGRGQGPAAPPAAAPAAPNGETTAPGGSLVAPAATSAAPAAPAGGRGGLLPPVTISNQTIRQVVRVSVGGERLRVVLSNAFGTEPVEIGAAHVALRDREALVKPLSVKPLMFGGSTTGRILPGATIVSDPVSLAVTPVSDLVVDLFLPGELGTGPSPVTTHNGALQTNYLSASGNHSGAMALTVERTAAAWFLLSRVEVTAASGAGGAVVAFGDSITDGSRSTADTNSRWPDYLARRLAARQGTAIGVLNAGIGGNRVLGDGAGVSALARFDRDVLMQTGVTHVIIMEGINDIGIARTNPVPGADDLIAGHKQLIARAHARGLKVYGATLTPFEGAAYWTAEGEAKRQALNQWIRTSGAYDAVIDFDQITRDPAAPTKFLAAYDSGDHLHPGDAGYKAMGEAVDLKLFP